MIRSKADKRFERAACIVMFAIMLIILFPFLLLFMSSITEESSLLVNGYSIFPDILRGVSIHLGIQRDDFEGLSHHDPGHGGRDSGERDDHSAGGLSAVLG